MMRFSDGRFKLWLTLSLFLPVYPGTLRCRVGSLDLNPFIRDERCWRNYKCTNRKNVRCSVDYITDRCPKEEEMTTPGEHPGKPSRLEVHSSNHSDRNGLFNLSVSWGLPQVAPDRLRGFQVELMAVPTNVKWCFTYNLTGTLLSSSDKFYLIPFSLSCIKTYSGQYHVVVHSLPKSALIGETGSPNMASADTCANGILEDPKSEVPTSREMERSTESVPTDEGPLDTGDMWPVIAGILVGVIVVLMIGCVILWYKTRGQFSRKTISIFFHRDDAFHAKAVEELSNYLKEDWSLNVVKCRMVKYQEFINHIEQSKTLDATIFVNSKGMYASYLSFAGETRHFENESSDFLVNNIISIFFDYTIMEHVLFSDHRFKLMDQVKSLVTVLAGKDYSKLESNPTKPWCQSSIGLQLKQAIDDTKDHYSQQRQFDSAYQTEDSPNTIQREFIPPDFMSIDSEASERVLDARLRGMNGNSHLIG